ASAGLADAAVRGDVGHLEQVRVWCGRPLWDMEPADADAYFGKVIRGAASGTRLARTQALTTYFQFLELRHQVEIHQLTGRALACPIDEMNRPRGVWDARLRIPPTDDEVASLFAGWREQLVGCRKFAPTARNYAAARLMAGGSADQRDLHLDLDDIKWDLGRFGKLHVRQGKGTRGSGPRERMVPLINNAGRTLRWFIEDVWCHRALRPCRPALRPPGHRPPVGDHRRARGVGILGEGPLAGLLDALGRRLETRRPTTAESCTGAIAGCAASPEAPSSPRRRHRGQQLHHRTRRWCRRPRQPPHPTRPARPPRPP
ncbi:MAG: hypothetical protein ACR2MP_06455, partial [Streptosporangiaceae bacterium]